VGLRVECKHCGKFFIAREVYSPSSIPPASHPAPSGQETAPASGLVDDLANASEAGLLRIQTQSADASAESGSVLRQVQEELARSQDRERELQSNLDEARAELGGLSQARAQLSQARGQIDGLLQQIESLGGRADAAARLEAALRSTQAETEQLRAQLDEARARLSEFDPDGAEAMARDLAALHDERELLRDELQQLQSELDIRSAEAAKTDQLAKDLESLRAERDRLHVEGKNGLGREERLRGELRELEQRLSESTASSELAQATLAGQLEEAHARWESERQAIQRESEEKLRAHVGDFERRLGVGQAHATAVEQQLRQQRDDRLRLAQERDSLGEESERLRTQLQARSQECDELAKRAETLVRERAAMLEEAEARRQEMDRLAAERDCAEAAKTDQMAKDLEVLRAECNRLHVEGKNALGREERLRGELRELEQRLSESTASYQTAQATLAGQLEEAHARWESERQATQREWEDRLQAHVGDFERRLGEEQARATAVEQQLCQQRDDRLRLAQERDSLGEESERLRTQLQTRSQECDELAQRAETLVRERAAMLEAAEARRQEMDRLGADRDLAEAAKTDQLGKDLELLRAECDRLHVEGKNGLGREEKLRGELRELEQRLSESTTSYETAQASFAGQLEEVHARWESERQATQREWEERLKAHVGDFERRLGEEQARATAVEQQLCQQHDDRLRLVQDRDSLGEESDRLRTQLQARSQECDELAKRAETLVRDRAAMLEEAEARRQELDRLAADRDLAAAAQTDQLAKDLELLRAECDHLHVEEKNALGREERLRGELRELEQRLSESTASHATGQATFAGQLEEAHARWESERQAIQREWEERLQAHVLDFERRLAVGQAHATAVEQQLRQQRDDRLRFAQERDSLGEESKRLRTQLQARSQECDELAKRAETLVHERAAMLEEAQARRQEVDRLAAERDSAEAACRDAELQIRAENDRHRQALEAAQRQADLASRDVAADLEQRLAEAQERLRTATERADQKEAQYRAVCERLEGSHRSVDRNQSASETPAPPSATSEVAIDPSGAALRLDELNEQLQKSRAANERLCSLLKAFGLMRYLGE
jgi:chromosome segregation protein